jgi:hypothetical protein
MQPKLYRMGFRCGTVRRTTLAHANDTRDSRIYQDFAQELIARARTLYADEDLAHLGLDLGELTHTVYAFDATTIDLCLTLFPWARFHHGKAAVKLHTLLDLRGNIPTVLHITEGAVHEVNLLDQLAFEPGATYVVDRGYIERSHRPARFSSCAPRTTSGTGACTRMPSIAARGCGVTRRCAW